jgi:hypothetical protein
LGRLRILRRICGKNNKTHLTPKFIAMNSAEDIDERSSIAAKLLKNDSLIRLPKFHEVKEYISAIYQSDQ